MLLPPVQKLVATFISARWAEMQTNPTVSAIKEGPPFLVPTVER